MHYRTLCFIALLTMVLLVPGAMAFSVPDISVNPAIMNPGDPVNVTCTVYVASGTSFSSYDDLQFVTSLDDPIWVYTVIINGVENTRPSDRGKTLTIGGYEISYPAADQVVVRVSLKGEVPAGQATGANISVIRIQELDARSRVIASSVTDYSHLVGLPTPTPTPAYGSIAIRSEPAGANVYLDNTIRGITPLTLDAVPNGRHTVLLRAEGYGDYTRDVTVMAGSVELDAVMTARTVTQATATAPVVTPAGTVTTTTIAPVATTVASTTGSLSVTTSPSGALVYIDGKMKGVTPTTIPGLSPGSHSIRIIMDGYQDLETTTEITAGTTSEFVTGLSKQKQLPGFTGVAVLAAIGLLLAGRKTGKGN